MTQLPAPGPKYDANNESETRNILSRLLAKVFRSDTAPDLGAIEELTGTGIAARTADDTWALLDYAVSTWTPSLGFATAGDHSVAYAANGRVGNVLSIGRLRILWWTIQTSTWTHSTASGELRLTGVPTAASLQTGIIVAGALSFNGINKAGYSQVTPRIAHGASTIVFDASGMGVGLTTIGTSAASEAPSGTQQFQRGMLAYLVA